ncbi:hypothetical protein JVX93_06935 [Mycolicibacterium boenickei]|nr:hypothetical protein JVX93_06935 [Mycolicibacterium boenickei]
MPRAFRRPPATWRTAPPCRWPGITCSRSSIAAKS